MYSGYESFPARDGFADNVGGTFGKENGGIALGISFFETIPSVDPIGGRGRIRLNFIGVSSLSLGAR